MTEAQGRNRSVSSPDIHLDVLFTRHLTPADFHRLPGLLNGADVYAPESANWREKDWYNLQLIADGRRSLPANPSGRDEIHMTELRAMYGTRCSVLMADMPAGHALQAEHRSKTQNYGQMRGTGENRYIGGNFEGALAAYRYTEEVDGDILFRRREQEIIVPQLRLHLVRIAERLKKRIRAVMTMGKTHADMALDLGPRIQVDRLFNGPAGHRGFDTQVLNAFRSGEVPDDGLLAKALFEGIVTHGVLDPLTDKGWLTSVVGHSIASQLSIANIEALSAVLGGTNFGIGVSNIARFPTLTVPFKAAIRNMGVRLPDDEVQLEQMYNEIVG